MIATDIGAHVKTLSAFRPVAQAAGSPTAIALDRLGFNSCELHVGTGASTGAPTSLTVDASITHSDTSGGAYTAYTPPTGSAAIAQITGVNSEARASVNLAGAKRFVKGDCDVAFVGGTAPTVVVDAELVLGGADTEPQA